MSEELYKRIESKIEREIETKEELSKEERILIGCFQVARILDCIMDNMSVEYQQEYLEEDKSTILKLPGGQETIEFFNYFKRYVDALNE